LPRSQSVAGNRRCPSGVVRYIRYIPDPEGRFNQACGKGFVPSFCPLLTCESACYIHTPYRATRHMSTLKEFRSCLNELAAATPRKKAALIRSLLPSIEAALSSGQTLKDIWTTLEKKGLGMAYRVFQMTVWRARRNKKATAPRDWEKVNVSSLQEPLQQSEPLPICSSAKGTRS
jgi:hypothetical protein